MLLEKFINGQNYTIGVELELRVLDKTSLSLQNNALSIFENIDAKYKNNLTGEFLSSMLEINTPVFKKPSEINNYLTSILSHLRNIASEHNSLLIGNGSYALKSKDVKLSDDIRYEKLYKEHQILLEKFTICGLHVHVGFENFDEALDAFNFSLKYLPLFVALSASSLFYDGKYTGIDSFRTKIFEQLPKGSIPEYFDTYEEMKSVYDLLKEYGVINSEKDVWWDVRIQPNLKTLEFRICDSVNDMKRIEVIVALIQGMCKLSKYKKSEKLPLQLLKQNMWSATRYSMNGDIIYKDKKLSIKKALKELVDEMKFFKILDSVELVEEYIRKDSISYEMKKTFERTNSFKSVERLGELG